MFDNFEIRYNDGFLFDEFVSLGINMTDVERVFYSEHHAFHIQTTDYFVIGYTGRTMLIVGFLPNFEQNAVIITEIEIANGEDIDQKYCRARRR